MADTRVVHEIVVKTDDAEKNTKNLGTSLKKFATIGTAVFGSVSVAVGKLAKDFTDTTDRIDKMSQKMGMSTQAFQEWEFILSQSGASIESLQGGMKTLTNHIANATDETSSSSKAFKILGVEVKDANGELRSSEEVFEDTIRALQGMENETERNAIANQLLGRSAVELAPLLNAGAESIDEMKQQAHELGIVIEDETIDAGVQLADKMDQVERSFNSAKTQATTSLVPALLSLGDIVIDHVIPAVSKIIEWLAKLPAIIQENSTLFKILGGILLFVGGALLVVKVVMAVVTALTTLWTAVTTIATAVTSAFGVVMAILSSPITLIIIVIGILIFTIIYFKDELLALWERVKEVFSNMASWISEKVSAIIEFFSNLWENIKEIFSNIKNWIVDTFNAIWESVKNTFDKIWGWISEKINAIMDKLKAWGNGIKDFFSGIGTAISDAIKSSINFVIGLINKFLGGFNSMIKTLNKVPLVNIPTIPKIPTLATGGLAFGPTLSVVGDNPNANIDPEVIAPLSKLENMVGQNVQSNVKIELSSAPIEIDGEEVAQILAPHLTRIVKIAGGNI